MKYGSTPTPPIIAHCQNSNVRQASYFILLTKKLLYKMHPEFWLSARQIFKTSLYNKTRLILENLRYAVLWCVQIIGFIMAWRLYSFVCTLHYLTIIVMQTCMKALNTWNACQMYSAECVSMFHSFSFLFWNIWDCVFSAYPLLPEASIGLRVLSLPASVRPSVRQSVRPLPSLSAW